MSKTNKLCKDNIRVGIAGFQTYITFACQAAKGLGEHSSTAVDTDLVQHVTQGIE